MAGRDARRAQAAQNDHNHPAAQRQRLEDAGFNPAAYLEGAGNQAMPAASGHMGTAISEAAGILGSFVDENSKRRDALAKEQQKNDELQKRLRDALLRPTIGGIFSNQNGRQPFQNPFEPRGIDELKIPSDDRVDTGSDWANDEKGTAASDEKYKPGTRAGVFFGLPWRRSGLFGDGEWVETAYGDTPLNWPIAAASMGSDFGYNMGLLQDHVVDKVTGANPTYYMEDGKRYQLYKPKRGAKELYQGSSQHKAIGSLYGSGSNAGRY